MAQTVSVDTKTIQHIMESLEKLTQDVAELKAKLFDQEPPYGSDTWWEKEIKEGEEDIKKGNFYELKDKKDLDDFFNNIYSDASNEKYHHKVRR